MYQDRIYPTYAAKSKPTLPKRCASAGRTRADRWPRRAFDAGDLLHIGHGHAIHENHVGAGNIGHRAGLDSIDEDSVPWKRNWNCDVPNTTSILSFDNLGDRLNQRPDNKGERFVTWISHDITETLINIEI